MATGVRDAAARKNLASAVVADGGGGGGGIAADAAMVGCGCCRPSSLGKRYLLVSYYGLQSYARLEQEVPLQLNTMIDSREDETTQKASQVLSRGTSRTRANSLCAAIGTRRYEA